MSIHLDRTERRVMGCLVEKQLTVPETYPLTLNALVLACNQKNNRDPEMSLTEPEVAGAARALCDRGWAEEVDPPTGRTRRFAHRAVEQLAVEPQDLAILAELWLRGPQSAQELHRRAGRMRPFASAEEVEARLRGMEARGVPFVRRLGRREGERHPRWEHTFTPDAERAAQAPVGAAAAPAPTAAPTAAPQAEGLPTLAEVVARIERLEAEVAALRRDAGR